MLKKIVPVFILTLFLTLAFAPTVSAEHSCCCLDAVTGEETSMDNVADNVTCQNICSPDDVKSESLCDGSTSSNNNGSTSSNNNDSTNNVPSAKLTDPLNLKGDISNLWIKIIKAMLGFVAIASLVTFVYAGFMFLISTGNAEKIKKAKDTIVYAILGIFISIASFVILNFILSILEGSL